MGVTVDAELFSIDAKNGQLREGFGKEGRVDLRKGLGEHPATCVLLEHFSSSNSCSIKFVLKAAVCLIMCSTDIFLGGVVRAFGCQNW